MNENSSQSIKELSNNKEIEVSSELDENSVELNKEDILIEANDIPQQIILQ